MSHKQETQTRLWDQILRAAQEGKASSLSLTTGHQTRDVVVFVMPQGAMSKAMEQALKAASPSVTVVTNFIDPQVN